MSPGVLSTVASGEVRVPERLRDRPARQPTAAGPKQAGAAPPGLGPFSPPPPPWLPARYSPSCWLSLRPEQESVDTRLMRPVVLGPSRFGRREVESAVSGIGAL